jgi:RNA polymerase sigma-70 factor (ECF subfamily)
MIGVMARPAEVMPADRVHPRDFDAWMTSEQRRVFQLCYRMLGEKDEADTATQEVFLKAYRALSGPRGAEPADPARWLTRVAVNTCLDRLRSRRWRFWRQRPKGEDEQLILSLTPDPAPGAEDKLFAAQIARRLAAALGTLSERQRSVFVLKHYEDLSLEDIAGSLGLDVGTVKAHMARAVGKLRKELKDLYLRPAPAAGRGEVGT